MRIQLLDQILEYESNESILDDIFKELNDKISDSNLVVSHLSIDGEDIYIDFYDYILDHIKTIQDVKVVTKSVKETSMDILISTLDYIERAIPEIEALSNEFYKTPTKNSWKKLSELIEAINWIIGSYSSIDSNVELKHIINNYEDWNLYAKEVHALKDLVKEFEEILQNNDLVSTADILSYEIIPVFNNMKEKLEKLVYREAT